MSAHYAPYPLFVEDARGSRLTDADGHEFIDFMNNFTSLILGHAHPNVVEAVSDQMRRGSALAAPTRSQLELARLLRDRVPSVETLRFTASGSEATLMALRCARAFTGRDKVMKMEGGYHGSYELAEVSLVPLPGLAGPAEAPQPVPVDASGSSSLPADVVICPYNDPERARSLIEKNADDLAAVIVEPVLGSLGMIPARREFLLALRDATVAHGVVLVFDEVITLRLDEGGAQSLYGVTPDLTAMGKIIGGGLPIGAFGGREDLMRLFSPDEPRPVMHSSTFSGNPLSMAAGAAALKRVDAALLERVDELGERLRGGFNRAFQRQGVRGQATGIGSLANIHLTDQPISNARDSLEGIIAGGAVSGVLHLLMLERGIFGASRLMYCTSATMTADDVDRAVAALEDALVTLKPDLEREAPHLLA
jgi:glutamate-1-semialdehyde 2,1-aminomutase